ncbi:hypothetical protein BFN03_07880 [Rhodococcus sp. WMMA185]|uniref:class I SAM-dependent methyltransferase n=1 Tax=Rhodococcus sp. WMMA185 TaxID=679318 RepID=UPI000879030C|nr:class I SAM-dependent methyltransferase [Rhodococcus sp. WMMA185]AOW92637.1 hypothetical protein BFN03_07880 [Rhodococcus sp. WMMA185]
MHEAHHSLDFDWNSIYRGDGSDTAAPDPLLLAHTAALMPGMALDLGCGAGGNALELVRRGWRVTGVDIAPNALASARASARARGLDLELALGDTASWRPSTRYDLVLSSYALPIDPAAQAATFATFAAALAPGGTLVLSEWDGERLHWSGPGDLLTETELREGIDAAGLHVERVDRISATAHQHRGFEQGPIEQAALIVVARASHAILESER